MSDNQAAVSLLFAEGGRPTAAAIREAVAFAGELEVSFEPADDPEQPGEPVWIELLSNGLTFDMKGLEPGPGAALPPRKRDLVRGDSNPERVEAVTVVPGPHLSGGSGMMPVLRTLACIAAAMSELDRVEAIAWHGARTWCDPQAFRRAVASWVEGGVFPGLLLTSVTQAPDFGLHSEGLALFIGQELRIEPELAEDTTGATRLALRLFDYLTERGRLAEPESLTGPEGKGIRLEPSANGRFVRVSRE